MVSRGTSYGALAVVVGACALLTPNAAHGHPGVHLLQVTPADKTRAADLFEKSAEAYRRGDFKQAIELLDEAYAIDPQPVLVYNRARAAEGLGNMDDAIAGYEKFLAEDPNAVDRGAIEQRLATLRRQRDERAALEKARLEKHESQPAEAPPQTTVIVRPQPARPSLLPLIMAGAGVVGLGLGGALGGLAVSKRDDAAQEPVQRTSMDLKSSADGLATASTVSFVAGAVLLVGGVVWWLVDHRSSSASKTSGLGSILRVAQ